MGAEVGAACWYVAGAPYEFVECVEECDPCRDGPGGGPGGGPGSCWPVI